MTLETRPLTPVTGSSNGTPTPKAGDPPPGRRIEIEWIKPSEMWVDERVQRVDRPAQSKSIAAIYDERALGVPEISHRADDRLHLLNGQARRGALILLGLADVPIRCVVHYGLSLAEEAALFLTLNRNNNVNALDRFRIGVRAGYAMEVAIDNCVTHYGLRVAKCVNGCECPDALCKLYKAVDNASIVDRTLRTTVAAWGVEHSATRCALLGIGGLYITYGDAVKDDRLIAKLTSLRGGPAAIETKGAELRELRVAKNLADGATLFVRNLYNDGLRKAAKLA